MPRSKLTDAADWDATKRDPAVSITGCAGMGGTLLAQRILRSTETPHTAGA
jgi:hypothetical protein